MVLTLKEKIEKFVEGAKTAAISPVLVGPEYFKNLANKYGWEKWNYYATVAAFGSVIVKKNVQFEESGKYELIDTYRTAIKNWDQGALELIDELMEFIISQDIASQDEFYHSIGVWVIERVTGSQFNSENDELAQNLGWRIRNDMDLYMFH